MRIAFFISSAAPGTLSARYQEAFEFCHLGEQPPARVSTFLRGVDFGIATPPALIGKSATASDLLARLSEARRGPARPRLPGVAGRFIEDLSAQAA